MRGRGHDHCLTDQKDHTKKKKKKTHGVLRRVLRRRTRYAWRKSPDRLGHALQPLNVVLAVEVSDQVLRHGMQHLLDHGAPVGVAATISVLSSMSASYTRVDYGENQRAVSPQETRLSFVETNYTETTTLQPRAKRGF